MILSAVSSARSSIATKSAGSNANAMLRARAVVSRLGSASAEHWMTNETDKAAGNREESSFFRMLTTGRTMWGWGWGWGCGCGRCGWATKRQKKMEYEQWRQTLEWEQWARVKARRRQRLTISHARRTWTIEVKCSSESRSGSGSGSESSAVKEGA